MWRPVFASRVCLLLGAGACRQILPSADTPGGISWEHLSKWRVVPCGKYRMCPGNCISAGQEGLVEGCGEAGRELKRCSEVSRTQQMRRETNNAENRKTDVLGNYGPTPWAPAKEDGTNSMISGSHELQLLHSAPVLQPDVFECSFSPSCPDTAPAVSPCSGNAPHACLVLSQVPSPPGRVSQGSGEGGRSQV